MGFDPVKCKRAKVFRHWLLVILGYECGRCWISCWIRIRGRNRCGGRRGRLFLVKYDVDHLKLLHNDTPPAIAACPVQKHIGRIACQNIFHGAWILPDPSGFREFGTEDLRDPALDNGVCSGLQILFGWRLMGRRKREQWPDGFYLLGRKKQQPQSGDEDPKNDQKENGPQAGNVGQQSKLSQNYQYLIGNVSLTVFVIHADTPFGDKKTHMCDLGKIRMCVFCAMFNCDTTPYRLKKLLPPPKPSYPVKLPGIWKPS